MKLLIGMAVLAGAAWLLAPTIRREREWTRTRTGCRERRPPYDDTDLFVG